MALPAPPNCAVRARAFTDRDEPRVLDILQKAFDGWLGDVEGVDASEFFRWKHMHCPFGPSTLLVAEADDAAIGFGAYLPWRFRARGELLSATRGVDFAVDPAYHYRGASMALRAAANHARDVAFMWANPNGRSRPGSIKAGEHQVGELGRYVRALRPLGKAIQRVGHLRPATLSDLSIEAESAAEVLRDDACISQLLADVKNPSDRLATVKDAPFLRWRYGRFANYRAVRAGADGRAGIAIFRISRRGPFWISTVCELFVEHDDIRIARQLLRRVREAADADVITCMFPSRRHAALCGFVAAPGANHLIASPFHQHLTPDPTQRVSWALSHGDLELI